MLYNQVKHAFFFFSLGTDVAATDTSYLLQVGIKSK